MYRPTAFQDLETISNKPRGTITIRILSINPTTQCSIEKTISGETFPRIADTYCTKVLSLNFRGLNEYCDRCYPCLDCWIDAISNGDFTRRYDQKNRVVYLERIIKDE